MKGLDETDLMGRMGFMFCFVACGGTPLSRKFSFAEYC